MKQTILIQQAILDNLEDLFKQKKETISNKDPDALHRLRVSARKLRINLWALKLLFPIPEYNKIKKEIRKIGKPLNPARDLDTQIAILLQLKAEKHIINYFKDQRIKLQPRIAHNLAKVNRLHLRERIKGSLGDPKRSLSKQVLLEISKQKINKKLKRLLRYADYPYCARDLKKLHSLRIAAKHLRYTLELFQPLYSKKLNNFISCARLIQRTLGDMRNYLILSKSRALNNPRLKNKLISLGNKSYAKFTEIWKIQSTWTNLNALINT